MNRNAWILAAAVVACSPGVEWTRLKGRVKAVNLKSHSLTIENKDGDLLTIPIDYQVKMMDKAGVLHVLKDIQLDDKLILTRTPEEQPLEDGSGLVPDKYP